MIAVIDGQPVGCRNSCFPSIQFHPFPVRRICNPAQLRSYVPADCKSRRNIEVCRAWTPKPTMPKHWRQPRWVGLRQYRVARWFLLPEAELRPRLVTR